MPDTIRFRCYYCHRIHTVSEEAAGKRGRCVCGKLMLVPAVMADVGASSQSIPLALPPAVPPPDGEGDVADLELDARPRDPAPESSSPGVEPEPMARTRSLKDTRPLPKDTVWMERRGRPETGARKGGSPVLGSLYIIFSFVALAAWVLHQFFSGPRPVQGRLLWAYDPNFAGLPAAFWSTVFLSLAIVLFLEGVHRVRRARA